MHTQLAAERQATAPLQWSGGRRRSDRLLPRQLEGGFNTACITTYTCITAENDDLASLRTSRTTCSVGDNGCSCSHVLEFADRVLSHIL